MAERRTTNAGTSWCSVRFDAGAGAPTVVVRERVRLSDTDSSGLIYYGTVTNWLNRAQSELWIALGLVQEGLGPSPMMPVVNANLSYHAPLQLLDEYELRGWIAEVGTSSATLAFEITRDGERCVSATMTHVHLDPATMRPAPLPPEIVGAAAGTR